MDVQQRFRANFCQHNAANSNNNHNHNNNNSNVNNHNNNSNVNNNNSNVNNNINNVNNYSSSNNNHNNHNNNHNIPSSKNINIVIVIILNIETAFQKPFLDQNAINFFDGQSRV
ncbi:hypothetical protein HELRODRAFT_179598 [Helobdella robusta]|uniref:Uncharacterized protein n=1 Tax=Helobdella robusta TaxID=6412 RepID=T1FEX4_HELRO|nr:hypothetical protein HELRODRAFT_179598 [Helobdella robusta]ESN95260.1 hypothetical protein HELRODRAFT_179598 [Helobdella robusta]